MVLVLYADILRFYNVLFHRMNKNVLNIFKQHYICLCLMFLYTK